MKIHYMLLAVVITVLSAINVTECQRGGRGGGRGRHGGGGRHYAYQSSGRHGGHYGYHSGGRYGGHYGYHRGYRGYRGWGPFIGVGIGGYGLAFGGYDPYYYSDYTDCYYDIYGRLVCPSYSSYWYA